MSQAQIEEIELNLAEAKTIVNRGDALERLLANPDFKEIVLDGYLEKEAVRLVHLKADHSAQDAESQAAIVRQMDAIGSLTQYFNMVRQQAYMAQKAMEADEASLDELRAEALEE